MADRDKFELRPSLMDRLVDEKLGDSSLLDESLFIDVDTYLDSIRGDLEDLLNTRQSRSMVDCPFPLVKASILAYGLPDLNSIPGATARDYVSVQDRGS